MSAASGDEGSRRLRRQPGLRRPPTPTSLRHLDRGVRRALRQGGPDREAAVLIGKSALAATVAWYLAASVLDASLPTFAPFSAVLMMQATIAESLDRSLRYTAAVLVGVGLVGLTVPPWGPSLWLFAVLVLLALGIGRWRRLGTQGTQVAVAAVFAYGAFATSSGVDEATTQLPTIAAMVLLGCAVGLVTNVVIAPPLRYRDARYGVELLCRSVVDLIADMVDGLRDGAPGQEETDDWAWRASRLPRMAAQARYAVEHAAAARTLNPRRLLGGDTGTFDGYRVIVNTTQRCIDQLRSIAQGLSAAAGRPPDLADQTHDRFLRDFARVLAAVHDAVDRLGRMHTIDDLRTRHGFGDEVQRAHSAHDSLVEHAEGHQLDHPRQWAIYGGLHTDSLRLVQELDRARHDLDRLLSDNTDPDSAVENVSAAPQSRPRRRRA